MTLKTPEQIAQATLSDSYLATMDYPEGVLSIIARAIEADRAQRPEGQGGTERIVFFWSREVGDCVDCGNPAAFYAPYRFGYTARRSDETKLCAVCAANNVADGNGLVEWIKSA